MATFQQQRPAPDRFAQLLLAWYDAHRRDLPWRGVEDPYRIWVSEIMLQQTRVAAVIGYYERFLQRFPAVETLARARSASVLAAWSGLGYYRRARAMHAAAKQIVKEHGGRFPSTSAQLASLPGIGRYTAAAIASIAFGEAVALVDGNVERVLQRFFGKQMTREETWERAQSLLAVSRPGDFNQGLMELGATVCLPRQPNCPGCPLVTLCQARGELPQAKREVRRKREVCYGLHTKSDSVWLVQRASDSSLMAGMWELPEVDSNGRQHLLTLKHAITVTDYTVRVLRLSGTVNSTGRWVRRSRLPDLPLTGLTRKILRATDFI